MNYTGKHCFSCSEAFTDDDDVVVCPDCGTPYHRDCYKQNGQCINHELHESGKSWQEAEKESTPEPAAETEAAESADDKNDVKSKAASVKICSRCFCPNDPSLENCRNCGRSLEDAVSVDEHKNPLEGMDPSKEYLGFDPEEDMGEGSTLKEVSHFVGSNTFYYIPLFKRMKELGSKISFNFICLFFPYYYFANRKMWLWAILTTVLSVIFNIPAMLYFIGEQSAQVSMPYMQEIAAFLGNYKNLIVSLNEICAMADWLLRIAMSLFANWLYFRFTLRSIKKIKSGCKERLSIARVRAKGGVAPVNLVLITVIMLALFAAVYMALVFLLILMGQYGVF